MESLAAKGRPSWAKLNEQLNNNYMVNANMPLPGTETSVGFMARGNHNTPGAEQVQAAFNRGNYGLGVSQNGNTYDISHNFNIPTGINGLNTSVNYSNNKGVEQKGANIHYQPTNDLSLGAYLGEVLNNGNNNAYHGAYGNVQITPNLSGKFTVNSSDDGYKPEAQIMYKKEF